MDDIRIDIWDDDANFHEVHIQDDLSLVIFSMDKAGRVTSKNFGKIDPMNLFMRSAEMSMLARKIMKEEK